MQTWPSLLRKPAELRGDDFAPWFTRVAAQLLGAPCLLVAGELHRFAEVEFYYYGDEHPDPFTHRDPLQRECGRWYFHRNWQGYRGGSFKGLDLTFGDGRAYGGVLIRGILAPDDTLIDGPSLCVDFLLARTGTDSPAALDARIDGRAAWDAANPLRLALTEAGEPRHMYTSARVGLSLQRTAAADALRYIMRPYRYLTEPRRTAKGKLQLVLALHAEGVGDDAIRQLTGCPGPVLRRYLANYEAGYREGDVRAYVHRRLGVADLCRLYGAWQATFGGGGGRAE